MLYTDDTATGIALDTPAWFTWLTTATTFYYQSPDGFFTAHHEVRRRGGTYWIAYRRQNGRLHRLHLGKPGHLTRDRLDSVALSLALPVVQPASPLIPLR
jgi:LuxR family maltose regulon positive regulatory protein